MRARLAPIVSSSSGMSVGPASVASVITFPLVSGDMLAQPELGWGPDVQPAVASIVAGPLPATVEASAGTRCSRTNGRLSGLVK